MVLSSVPCLRDLSLPPNLPLLIHLSVSHRPFDSKGLNRKMSGNPDDEGPSRSPLMRLVRAMSGRKPQHNRTASAGSSVSQGTDENRPRKLVRLPPRPKTLSSSTSFPVSPLGLGTDHFASAPHPPSSLIERHAQRRQVNLFPLTTSPTVREEAEGNHISPVSPTRSPTQYTREERAAYLAKTREQEEARKQEDTSQVRPSTQPEHDTLSKSSKPQLRRLSTMFPDHPDPLRSHPPERITLSPKDSTSPGRSKYESRPRGVSLPSVHYEQENR